MSSQDPTTGNHPLFGTLVTLDSSLDDKKLKAYLFAGKLFIAPGLYNEVKRMSIPDGLRFLQQFQFADFTGDTTISVEKITGAGIPSATLEAATPRNLSDYFRGDRLKEDWDRRIS